ncbi:hypothetical protein CEQ90_16480 [Lewinellaceae bacterium SD302]|nr:hypothetical protein CEQ90_16480 [Lewinellaceae bacterium SD302]
MNDMSKGDLIPRLLRQSKVRLVMLVFTSEWSGAAQMLKTKLEGLQADEKYDFEVVYVELDEVPDLKVQFNVSEVPTTVVMRNHEIANIFKGAHSRGKLLEKFAAHL